ncbi:hypothetical protein ALPO108162_13620 [Alicyclobacillus pomorum]|jgi:hypothetical protein
MVLHHGFLMNAALFRNHAHTKTPHRHDLDMCVWLTAVTQIHSATIKKEEVLCTGAESMRMQKAMVSR